MMPLQLGHTCHMKDESTWPKFSLWFTDLCGSQMGYIFKYKFVNFFSKFIHLWFRRNKATISIWKIRAHSQNFPVNLPLSDGSHRWVTRWFTNESPMGHTLLTLNFSKLTYLWLRHNHEKWMQFLISRKVSNLAASSYLFVTRH